MSSKIDFVIAWVDGNDTEWLKEKNKYFNNDSESDINRFRDWGNLKYLFRGIEKFAPWVNKVFLVTCGHFPSWLNTTHPKLKCIKHTDYIPEEYLPTYNSHTIELNFHRIQDLNERFVYFNDDTFLIDHVKPELFFKNDLPCDALISALLSPDPDEEFFSQISFNISSVLFKYFNKKDFLKDNLFKWLNIKYGRFLLRNLYTLPFNRFTGFRAAHLPSSLKKSTFEQVWEKEFKILNNTCKNKFRSKDDVSQYLIILWQCLSGKFHPRRANIGRYFPIGKDNHLIYNAIVKQKYKMVCLNDVFLDIDYEKEKQFINNCLDQILNEKSSFEI